MTLLEQLRELYGAVESELEYATEFQFLIAVILSAQCRDETVNRATIELFDRFGTPELLSEASYDLVYEIIREVNLRAQKAQRIIDCARLIKEKGFPTKLSEFVKLPGVGRKTANVVMGNKEGVAVDTHVLRLAQRLGLTSSKRVEVVEMDLMLKFPDRSDLSLLLIKHGRMVCFAVSPACVRCPLFCPSRRTT